MPSSDDTVFGATSAAINTTDQQYAQLANQLNYMAQHPTYMTPGAMLQLQLQMTMMSQVTEMMSNLMAGINSMMSTVIRNMKGG